MSTTFTIKGKLPVKPGSDAAFWRLHEALGAPGPTKLHLSDGALIAQFEPQTVAASFVRHALGALTRFAEEAAADAAVFERGGDDYVVIGPDPDSCARCELALLRERSTLISRRIATLTARPAAATHSVKVTVRASAPLSSEEAQLRVADALAGAAASTSLPRRGAGVGRSGLEGQCMGLRFDVAPSVAAEVRDALAFVRAIAPRVQMVLFGLDRRAIYLDASGHAVCLGDLSQQGRAMLDAAEVAAAAHGLPLAFAG